MATLESIDISRDVPRDDIRCSSCRWSCCHSRVCQFILRNLLLILLLLSLILGIGLGAAMRTLDPPLDKKQQMYFRFPGDLLMRMLKMLIIPLIVSSLVSGLASLNSKASGRLGAVAVIYYLSTTFIAVVIGIILVLTIRPGSRTQAGNPDSAAFSRNVGVADSFLDLIRNMFPDNVVESCFRQTVTRYSEAKVRENVTYINTSMSINYTEEVERTITSFRVVKEDGMNVLGLVVFSIALGVVLSRLGRTGHVLTEAFHGMAEASMSLVTVIIWYSPVGILFLVASEIIKMADPVKELESLGLYIATVLTGLTIHGAFILPLIYFIIVRKNPYMYVHGVLQALLTALGTASSSATLPVTTRCLEENNRIDSRVVRFVLPVGATVNMDGTALYEAVAAIFIAQLRGISLNVGQIIAASITATAASIGAASVPQAGIVTMVIVLTALGLPTDDVSKILAVDWLLDRFRTMINVEGDAFGAAIVSHLSRNQLKQFKDMTRDTDSSLDLNHHPMKEMTESMEINANGKVNVAFDQAEERTTL